MIVVRVELWPAGDKSKATEIGRMVVSNITQEVRKEGQYDYEYSMNYQTTSDGVRRHLHAAEGRVKHTRSETVWHLIYRCLTQFGIEP